MRRPVTLPPLFVALLEIDAQLAARGFPALSSWWRATLRAFLSSGKKRFVLRCGRRSGKSTTLAKLAIVIALRGGWRLPPGEAMIVPFISIDRDEAAERLRNIKGMLDALGVSYRPRENEVEITTPGGTAIFRVVTASYRAAVGFSSACVVCDEVARWRDRETYENPAAEVVSSVAPTTATLGGFVILSSSAWSNIDYHAEQFALGDTDAQMAASGKTWECNPSLTEEQTRKLEPDPRKHAREYGNEPSDSVSSVCTRDEYAQCVLAGVERRELGAGIRRAAFFDPAFRHDRAVCMIAHREHEERPRDVVDVLKIDHIVHLIPSFARPLKPADVISKFAAACREYEVVTAYSDAHYRDMLQPALAERGIKLEIVDMTPAAMTSRIENLSSRIASRTIEFLDHVELRKEVLQAVLEMHPNGRITLRAPSRKGFHDDLLSALLLSCDADIQRRALPPMGGDIQVSIGPLHWEAETKTLHGAEPTFTRRTESGSYVPSEPPFASPAYERWFAEMHSRGEYTPSMQRFSRERGVALTPELNDHDWKKLNIPIVGN